VRPARGDGRRRLRGLEGPPQRIGGLLLLLHCEARRRPPPPSPSALPACPRERARGGVRGPEAGGGRVDRQTDRHAARCTQAAAAVFRGVLSGLVFVFKRWWPVGWGQWSGVGSGGRGLEARLVDSEVYYHRSSM
jgi:hypothetical protein